MACTLGLTVLGFLLAPVSVAAATVSIDPPDTTVNAGDEFVVRFVTDAFPDLKGFHLVFPYDPARLRLLSATEGDVLTSPGGAYAAFLIEDVTTPADTFEYHAAMLDGTTQGPGVLVFARFKALSPGDAAIACGSVDFRDSQNQSSFPACTGGAVHIRAPDVRISQVFGGGGDPGATLRNDFIELFNADSAAIDVTGWTVQYAPASASTWQSTELTGVIPPGGYYLVQEAQGAGGTADLPAPDAVGIIPIDAAAGKVALVAGAATLAGACPTDTSITDLVGYGPADCAESAPAPAPDATTAAWRGFDGCQDTDDNAADFSLAAPAPRNGASPVETCRFALDTSTAPVFAGTVARSPDLAAYAFGLGVELTAIPGPGHVFVEWTGDASGTANPITVWMDRDRTIVARFETDVEVHPVVISQVYGGGGEPGAVYRNDFVELFNRGGAAVDLTGWSVQYAAIGATWQTTTLSGTIEPGRYYLIQQAAGAGGTLDLPPPDAIGTIAMGVTSGKVALVAGAAPLIGACPIDPGIEDFVGYGTANCSESSPAADLSDSSAAHRLDDGCVDTDDNSLDFVTLAPAPRNTSSPLHLCTYWVDVESVTDTRELSLAIVPHPARVTAALHFSLPREGRVRLRVFDLQGRVVARLADDHLPAGPHRLVWNGAGPGGLARSGVYFVRLEAAGLTLDRPLVLTR